MHNASTLGEIESSYTLRSIRNRSLSLFKGHTCNACVYLFPVMNGSHVFDEFVTNNVCCDFPMVIGVAPKIVYANS